MNTKKKKTPANTPKTAPPPDPHRGYLGLQGIIDWCEYYGFDLGGFIAGEFGMYLDMLDAGDYTGPRPVDLPGGAPRDRPEPPRRPVVGF